MWANRDVLLDEFCVRTLRGLGTRFSTSVPTTTPVPLRASSSHPTGINSGTSAHSPAERSKSVAPSLSIRGEPKSSSVIPIKLKPRPKIASPFLRGKFALPGARLFAAAVWIFFGLALAGGPVREMHGAVACAPNYPPTAGPGQDSTRPAGSGECKRAAQVNQGNAYFEQGELDKAEKEFREALALDPGCGEAHAGLGRLRISQQQLPQAEEEFQTAIQVSPNYAPAYSGLAEIWIASGQPGKARGLLEKAVLLDPADWHAKFRLAGILMDAGQSARATELLKEVIRLRPDFRPAREQLGIGSLRRGDLEGASGEAEKLMAADPHALEAHRLMALVLWKKRDLESSLAECAEALARDPDSVSMLALESLELWQLNRKKDAREILARAGKLDPRLGNTVAFCRLLYCDARDISAVDDFLRKNHWVLSPPPSF